MNAHQRRIKRRREERAAIRALTPDLAAHLVRDVIPEVVRQTTKSVVFSFGGGAAPEELRLHSVTPVVVDGRVIGFSSGYVQRHVWRKR